MASGAEAEAGTGAAKPADARGRCPRAAKSEGPAPRRARRGEQALPPSAVPAPVFNQVGSQRIKSPARLPAAVGS